jgi:hypothetical protein
VVHGQCTSAKKCGHIKGKTYAESVWPYVSLRGRKYQEIAEKLHSEKLHDLYLSPNEIKSGRMRWAVNVACMGEKRYAYMVLVWKPEGGREGGREDGIN